MNSEYDTLTQCLERIAKDMERVLYGVIICAVLLALLAFELYLRLKGVGN